MGPGGELSKQNRQTNKYTEGGTPILIQHATGDDMAPTVRTDGFLGDDGEPPRHNTSSIRLDVPPGSRNRSTVSQRPTSAVPPRRQQQQQIQPRSTALRPTPRTTTISIQKKPAEHARFSVHWLLLLGVAMIVVVVLWILGSAVLAWGMQRADDIRYGNPRTYQVDKIVGHNDGPLAPSHFIAMNLHSQIVVIEFMGGNPEKAVTYLTPVFISAQNGDLAPVTLEFRDVNGDKLPDMLVHIHLSGQDQVSVFINDGKKFRPSNGGDKITL